MNALHCKGAIYNTLILLLYTSIFSYEKKSHSFIEITNLPSELEVAVVTVSHLTVEYIDGNMHTS